MSVHMKLSEYLQTLDFLGARSSSDYVGTKVDNPAMILEENIATWIKLTDLEDLQDCFKVFEDRVCVTNFPARYSPQFWLAHAALTTIYNVLCFYIESDCDEESKMETNNLLFELWCRLISSGPGSSHLEMMDIILKYQHYPLWKHLQTLRGDGMTILVSTLKTDFVYVEDVSADHYATLMETHVDKLFKAILSDRQMEEARRGLLDLCLFYLNRMNHVPPHIGPRLSHLCFLICNRYKFENPYMGYDDWVLLRHHLKTIKDVIIDSTFTVGSEAQYRAPLTLEKIFQAAIADKMLDIMFKDFMTLLLTICNHDNSKKCKRLFAAYQTGLFEPIDFKKGFDSTPNWMFDQCIQTLGKLSKTVAMETHIDEFIINAQHLILEKFSKLSTGQVASWHELMVNYLVSGRTLLIREAGTLLASSILKNNNGLNWKTYCDQCKLFIDIISDIPGAFLQNDSLVSTVQEYAKFVRLLLEQIMEFQLEGRVRQNVHKCLLQCLEKESALKAAISNVCVQSTIPDLTDANLIRDALFTIDTLLRDPGCPIDDKNVADVITIMLKACLELCRSKGYVAVDLNSLFMSICLSCLSGDSDHVTQSCDVSHDEKTDLWNLVYLDAVLKYLELHVSKGTVRSISPLVPQILGVMQDSIQKQGIIPKRCIDFLSVMSSDCIQFVSDHVTKILEIFLEWQNDCFLDLILILYRKDEQSVLSMFQEIFNQTLQAEHECRHYGMKLLEEMSRNHPELYMASHICLLLGTYSTETECTKGHILNIILNVSRHNPSTVVGYFSMLVDDSKFDKQSLPQRAPILKCLCQQNEELLQRSVEYLMKYVGSSTDDDITVVAMETLIPLLKDRSSLIQKQKVKLKNLWKMSNNSQVKDLCVKILPEIRLSGKSAPVKPTPNKIKADGKGNMNKGFKETIVGSKKVQQKTPRQLKENIVLPSKTSINRDKGIISGKKTATESSNIQIGVKVTVDVNSVKANETIDDTNDVEKAVKKLVEQEKDKVGKTEHDSAEIIHTNNESKKHVPDIALDKAIEVKDLTKAGGDTDNKVVEIQSPVDDSTKDQNKETGIVVTELIGRTTPKESNSKNDLQETGEVMVETETDSQKSDVSVVNSTLTTSDFNETKVHLYSCIESRAFIYKLSEKLKMAGYSNIVKDSVVDNGNNSTSAKVVILCCDRFDVNSDQSLAKQMADLEHNDVPVIYLRSKPHISYGSQQMTLTQGGRCIRFYVKPGEETVQGTKWPKYKFCELLMQLNYCGITRDDKMVTPEFRSLWETRIDEKEKHLRKSFDDRSFLLPDIFVSYQWGKQKQVEPLYSHLMSEGLLCWMGAYQMDGSESLYNKIQQGLQSCRVVLACVTKKYEHCEICQCDIKTASKLGRAIVPVLLDDCQWPLGGVMGDLLKGSDPIKLKSVYNVQRGFLPSGLKSLISRLRHYTVTNRDDHVLEIPSEIRCDAIDEEEEEEDDDDYETIDDFNENSEPSSRINSKSCTKSTLLEFKKYSGDTDIIARRHSNATDVVRRDVASGDMWSEDGYPLRASRSKSCTLL